MIEIPEFFAPGPEEAQKMAERTLQLKAAHETFMQRKAEFETRRGFIGSVAGKIGLHRAAKEAQKHGLTVINNDVIVPQVVPYRYLMAMEDDF